jgi:hypothetical protein
MFTITMRVGPGRLAAHAPQLARAFHSTPKTSTFFTARTVLRANSKPSSTLLSRIQGASRGYHSQYETAYMDPAARRKELYRKLFIGGAIFGGTLIAINGVFNRETREDGGMPPYERSYLHQTFIHTGLGVGIIGLTAYQMVQSGFVWRIMTANPWMVGLGGLALSFGSMIATRSIDPDKSVSPPVFPPSLSGSKLAD